MKVYYGNLRDTSNFTSNEFLHVNCSGTTVLKSGDKPEVFRVFRPEGRVDFYIVLIGKCTAEAVINGETHKLRQNDCILYYPHDSQDYSLMFDCDRPQICAYWVHFCGTAAEELMKKAGFKGSCVVRSVSTDLVHRFEALIRSGRNSDELGMLSNLLRVVETISPKFGKNESESVRLVRGEAHYISKNFADDIDLDKCAARCNLSRSRFTHVFTEVYGIPPHKYLLNQRFDQAKDLLLYSSLSVGEISEQCGFSDALYFSRLFSKNFGVSPSRYRELAQK